MTWCRDWATAVRLAHAEAARTGLRHRIRRACTGGWLVDEVDR